MKQDRYKIISNTPYAEEVWRMELSGDLSDFKAPGQFVNISVPGFFLRRPVSVSDITADGRLVLLYKALGAGTRAMQELKEGTEADMLTGLGNGFCIEKAGEAPLLLGGGIGCAPLKLLAKELINKGLKVKAVLGFNKASEIFLKDELEALGCEVWITTLDGSYKGERAVKGFVTDAMKEIGYSYFYACGPMPMLRAVYDSAEKAGKTGEFSLEERMGCGFGACMGCSIQTSSGAKRVCKDGPVFAKEELPWK